MLHFIFMVLPAFLSVLIMYNVKNIKGDFNKEEEQFYILSFLRDISVMVLLFNLIGLFIGKNLIGIPKTFIDGRLNDSFFSLKYLLIIILLSLIMGYLGRWSKENLKIFISKETVENIKEKRKKIKKEKELEIKKLESEKEENEKQETKKQEKIENEKEEVKTYEE